MKLSFSTVWADGDIKRLIHLLPFIDGLEIGSRGHRDFFLELQEFVLKDKKRVTSIHAVAHPGKELKEADYNPSFASLDDQKRRIDVEKICATADWALELGAKNLVIHAGEVEDSKLKELFNTYRHNSLGGEQVGEQFGEHVGELSEDREGLYHEIVARRKRLSREHLEAALDVLGELCRRFPSINFCIETRAHYHEIPTQEELEIIFKRLPVNNLAYWHDIGHTFMLDALGFIPMEGWQAAFGNRCAGVHLHDIDGGLNDHQPPGEGRLDFRRVLRSFYSTSLLTLEVHYRHSLESLLRGINLLRKANYMA